MNFTKTHKIIAGIAGAAAIVFGLLWYFQQQGFLKVFPTLEDRRIKKILVIDEHKFHPAEGLSPEIFQQKIRDLYESRKKVQANREDSKAWFDFGYDKEFLNDHEGAVSAWEEAFRRQPLNFLVAFNLANDYQYFLKDFPKAEFYYRKALDVQPAYTAAYQGLAELYRFNLKDKQNELEPLMLTAVKADLANQATYYAILVEQFAANGDMDKARDYLQRVKVSKPELYKELLEQYPKLK